MHPLHLLPLLACTATAHFSLIFPAPRGDTDSTQSTSPCGGLDTPSTTRTEWPLSGGQLSFSAGHDAANTAVYLALGNAPVADDFSVVLVDKFLQVGIGEFCWRTVAVPEGVKVQEGMNATVQIVQEGHSGGGLYNCADITFVSDPEMPESCSNGTNVGAEAAEDHGSHGGESSTTAAAGDASSTAPAATNSTLSGAGALRVAGGLAVAAVVGAAAWVL